MSNSRTPWTNVDKNLKNKIVHLLHNAERGVEPPNIHPRSLLEASWLQQAKEYEDEGEESEDDEAETKNMSMKGEDG